MTGSPLVTSALKVVAAATAAALLAACSAGSAATRSGSLRGSSAASRRAGSSSAGPHSAGPGLAGSGSAGPALPVRKILGCLAPDSGGIDDHSVNAASWQGMQDVHAAHPGKITVSYLQSPADGDYTPAIGTLIGDKCGIIVTVGFLMAGVTQATAARHTGQKFAIVDFAYSPAISNVDALEFNTVQDGFLGGYLAAGLSRTHVVATFGGQQLPTVTIYMDGFWDGVQYYNSRQHADVRVLGWNEQTQHGSFVNEFSYQAPGQALARAFIADGADVIFPVGGNVGAGAAQAVQAADTAAGSDKVNMLWDGTDGCVSEPQYCKYFISSVTQNIQAGVGNAVLAAATGTFRGGTYIGDLANGGVALAPFHDFASKVPAALQAQLAAIRQEIISGKIVPATRSPV